MNKQCAAIILAAGEGTRMKSETPKVMHPLCGRPMVSYVLDLAKALKVATMLVVVGHKRERLQEVLSGYKAKAVHQDKLLGTADAIKRCESALKNFSGNLLVLYGDQPWITTRGLKNLMQQAIQNQTFP